MLVDHAGLEAAAARLRRALELVTTIDRAGRELQELTADPADPLAGFAGAGILKRLEVREMEAIDDVARRLNLATTTADPAGRRRDLEAQDPERAGARLVDLNELELDLHRDVRHAGDAPPPEPSAEEADGATPGAAEPAETEAAGPTPPIGPAAPPAPPPPDASTPSTPEPAPPARLDLVGGSPETRTERLLDAVRAWFAARDRDWYSSGQIARDLGIDSGSGTRACKALLGAGELEHNQRGGAFSRYRITDAMVPADDQADEDGDKADEVKVDTPENAPPPAMQPNPRAGQPGEPDLVAGPGPPAPVVPISRRVQRELEREREQAAYYVINRELDAVLGDRGRRRIADAVLAACADDWRHPAAIAADHVINRQETTYVASVLHRAGRLERDAAGRYRVPLEDRAA